MQEIKKVSYVLSVFNATFNIVFLNIVRWQSSNWQPSLINMIIYTVASNT